MDAFWQAVATHDWEQPEIKQEFRLYYDESGNVLYYSMENLPGNYIVIDRHVFEEHRFDIRIRDGKIIKQSHPASWKLTPTDSAGYACHASDISIIVSDDYENKKHWKVTTTHEAD